MKKCAKILLPVLLPVVLAGVLIVAALSRGKQPEKEPVEQGKGITVLDSSGNVLASAVSSEALYQSDYWAYLDVVVSEAAEKIAEIKGCDQAAALESLFADGYEIQTAFREEAFRALRTADENRSTDYEIGCAITDLNGNLLAVYSTKGINYAAVQAPICDAFTPLSVYAPAIEEGQICWSSQYEDEGKPVSVYEALRTSSKTVAEKCLADRKAGEEIYLIDSEAGITPVHMAGFYQCFANGGKYTPPTAITKISTADGQVLYARSYSYRQVISPETADVMNKLLQGVVKDGGTGEAANCGDIQVAGKTGEDGDNYWFVGVTPGYSVAVWHGQNGNNRAAEVFASVIEELYRNQPNANRNFITHKNLQRLIYCTKSGMTISMNCSTIEEGYFGESNTPGVCDKCQAN